MCRWSMLESMLESLLFQVVLECLNQSPGSKIFTSDDKVIFGRLYLHKRVLGGNAMRWRFHTAAGCRLRLKETSLDTGPTSGDRQDYPGGPVRGTRSSSFNSHLTRQQHQGKGLVLPIHSLVQSLNVHTMASHSTHIPLSPRVSVRPVSGPFCPRRAAPVSAGDGAPRGRIPAGRGRPPVPPSGHQCPA